MLCYCVTLMLIDCVIIDEHDFPPIVISYRRDQYVSSPPVNIPEGLINPEGAHGKQQFTLSTRVAVRDCFSVPDNLRQVQGLSSSAGGSLVNPQPQTH